MKENIKVLLLIVALMSSASWSQAQKYDRHWLGGKGSVFKDTALSVLMRFDEEGISFIKNETNCFVDKGVIAMSDASGNHQFSTNGNVVVTWDGEVMVGGKGFNQGATNDDFGTVFGDTVGNFSYNPYTYQVIPDPYDDSIYYLIHSWVYEGVDEPWRIESDRMQISKIDMSRRNGRGEVVYKNRYFDEEVMSAAFAIIRHGNGRDWWVVLKSVDGLSYKSILFRRDSVLTKVRSSMEGLHSDWFNDDDYFAVTANLLNVSQDGAQMVDHYGQDYIKLLNFDRCSGEVSLVDTIHVGKIVDTGPGSSSSPYFYYYFAYQFSPSGRYLYGISYSNLAQWDLWANDISASRVDLGHPWSVTLHADGQWHKEYGGIWIIGQGPDGKLYILWRGTHNVIENPDEKCPDCGLCAGWDQGPPPSCFGVEYDLHTNLYPNYRLGALEGSACDTIPDEPELPVGEFGVSVWPNPASSTTTIEITLPEYESGKAQIAVVDVLGRYLYRYRFSPYTYLHQLDVSQWAAGVYNIVMLYGDELKATARLVVVR